MLTKDKEAKKLAVDEYFKHFDRKTAENETDADREVIRLRPHSLPTLTRSYRLAQQSTRL
jgi:sterol 24-C-methyltransferase